MRLKLSVHRLEVTLEQRTISRKDNVRDGVTFRDNALEDLRRAGAVVFFFNEMSPAGALVRVWLDPGRTANHATAEKGDSGQTTAPASRDVKHFGTFEQSQNSLPALGPNPTRREIRCPPQFGQQGPERARISSSSRAPVSTNFCHAEATGRPTVDASV